MKALLTLAAVAMLLAGAAGAQTTPDAAATSTAGSSPVAAAPAKPSDGKTVSGVTVSPTQPKACSSRDTACIAQVVAQLKAQYPKELKKFCFGREMQAMRTQLVADQLNGAIGGGQDPQVPVTYGVNSALHTACTTDKKADAKADKK